MSDPILLSLEYLLTLLSRQIRPPIYSIKQSRLRKRRVIRFATLYFFLLIVFILLFFGPIIVSKFISIESIGGSLPLDLMQPIGQNNNDTFSSVTGNALGNFGQDAAPTGGSGGGGDDSSSADSGGDDVFSFGGRMAVRWATIA